MPKRFINEDGHDVADAISRGVLDVVTKLDRRHGRRARLHWRHPGDDLFLPGTVRLLVEFDEREFERGAGTESLLHHRHLPDRGLRRRMAARRSRAPSLCAPASGVNEIKVCGERPRGDSSVATVRLTFAVSSTVWPSERVGK